jgi:hypothetical protein
MEAILSFLYYVSPALTAVIFGGIVVNHFFVRKANLGGLVDRVCNCLDCLSNDCAEYWSVDFSTEKQHNLAVLEARIKAQVLQINAMVLLINQKYGNVSSATRGLILDLQDACTGGDFESRQRKADIHRYMRAFSVIGRISIALQRLKI